jgi:hypothetical protein
MNAFFSRFRAVRFLTSRAAFVVLIGALGPGCEEVRGQPYRQSDHSNRWEQPYPHHVYQTPAVTIEDHPQIPNPPATQRTTVGISADSTNQNQPGDRSANAPANGPDTAENQLTDTRGSEVSPATTQATTQPDAASGITLKGIFVACVLAYGFFLVGSSEVRKFTYKATPPAGNLLCAACLLPLILIVHLLAFAIRFFRS